MKIRHSTYNDIPSIMSIIEQAQTAFKIAGIDQWQNHYPNIPTIENDIKLNESYVIEMDDKIVGTFVLSFRIEDTYNIIYDGEWLTHDAYAVIHRIAFDSSIKGKGYSKSIIELIEKMVINNNVYSIKIDTHEDNQIMRKMLSSTGFTHCGTILLRDGNKRLAFEKTLK